MTKTISDYRIVSNITLGGSGYEVQNGNSFDTRLVVKNIEGLCNPAITYPNKNFYDGMVVTISEGGDYVVGSVTFKAPKGTEYILIDASAYKTLIETSASITTQAQFDAIWQRVATLKEVDEATKDIPSSATISKLRSVIGVTDKETTLTFSSTQTTTDETAVVTTILASETVTITTAEGTFYYAQSDHSVKEALTLLDAAVSNNVIWNEI